LIVWSDQRFRFSREGSRFSGRRRLHAVFAGSLILSTRADRDAWPFDERYNSVNPGRLNVLHMSGVIGVRQDHQRPVCGT
jgi:hypothetical protein